MIDEPEAHTDTEEPIALAAEPEATEDPTTEEAEPLAFTFGDDPDAEAPDDSMTIRTMRDRMRDQAREIKELKANAPVSIEPVLGVRPTLEDHGYDEEKHAAAVETWVLKKADDERRKSETVRHAESQRAEFVKLTNDFEAKATELAIPNFMEAVDAVSDAFGDDLQAQQAKAFLVYAEDPRMIAALKASPAKLAELTALKNNPIKLLLRIGEMKGQIRTMPRRETPSPERIVAGGAPVNVTADATLAKLEKEAERTGDRTKIIAYKRQKKAA